MNIVTVLSLLVSSLLSVLLASNILFKSLTLNLLMIFSGNLKKSKVYSPFPFLVVILYTIAAIATSCLISLGSASKFCFLATIF